MSILRLKRLLTEQESIHLEFKEARFALPGNLFETISRRFPKIRPLPNFSYNLVV
ncbi:hypothetical protein CLV98_10695 [Dyadobacter jejuensis]|uniref:Uncharacterized protein n=1 Tax=Dyadobacter jejuensis TaxID=1082580 RepID=A0A316AKR9_9BACT|nr:hypothetical protein CLV98_10695 [Dyadobacter jejuensis]